MLFNFRSDQPDQADLNHINYIGNCNEEKNFTFMGQLSYSYATHCRIDELAFFLFDATSTNKQKLREHQQ